MRRNAPKPNYSEMSIFDLHQEIVADYERYVQSFLSIADDRIREFVRGELSEEKKLWPDALLQLSPSYKIVGNVGRLVAEDLLHPPCEQIFCDGNGLPYALYSHQREAIEKASGKRNYIVTSGTGSGKSLAYFIPIFDAVLRSDPAKHRVRAIVVYPMNALVNSQLAALQQWADGFKGRTGQDLPIRFGKYTGQEGDAVKTRLQQNPPHILLTNYVMLELMLLRPTERVFVDQATTGLQFLVFDELHTYRGRQGADVALLARRLRERCGNPRLLCIGTSATMVSDEQTSPHQRRQIVAGFAEKIFGAEFTADDVIEETLRRTATAAIPEHSILRMALNAALPDQADEFKGHPLTAWIEQNFGLEAEADGKLKRRTPRTLSDGALQLLGIIGQSVEECESLLRAYFLRGSKLRTLDGEPIFAFKLHQLISQGQAIYASLEDNATRLLRMDAQYYAAPTDLQQSERVMFPLRFCRICGQDYYSVLRTKESGRLMPYTAESEAESEADLIEAGYLMLADETGGWSVEQLPSDWLEPNGKVKKGYRHYVPQQMHYLPDGGFSPLGQEGSIRCWYQPKPFMLCLNCGEFYTGRDKDDFRKLSGLSSEGRSTTTTVLCASSLRHAPSGDIPEEAHKILSFTDNRQDASLQSGHFNDFVQVSLLRGAIYAALEKYGSLRFDEIAEKALSASGLLVGDYAFDQELAEDSARARGVRRTFRELLEYRIYEDLRRGWRVIQPNLEQCGMLRIEYDGLDELCQRNDKWQILPEMSELTAGERKKILTALLDHFRRKLAIYTSCLEETEQQQLRKKSAQELNDRWKFDEAAVMHTAECFLLPEDDNGRARTATGASLAENSLLGRWLRRELDIPFNQYRDFIDRLTLLLINQGLLRKGEVRGTAFVQIDAATLIWRKSDSPYPPADPIYSRRAVNPAYAEAERRANEFFRTLYQNTALLFRRLEGQAHTAQVKARDREEREQRFRSGQLSALFCSPTMELGIDIRELRLVHMRNVPPTPANYAQRSGRAGRAKDPALVVTYCSAGSGHDQYYFRYREKLVAGSVRAPRLDLGNQDMIEAHLHAIWLAKVQLPLRSSITDILDEMNAEANYPLRPEVSSQINLSESRLMECLEEARRILLSCGNDVLTAVWYSDDWLRDVLRRAPLGFDKAFERWRALHRTATLQFNEAQQARSRALNRDEQQQARRLEDEAERQLNLLRNLNTTAEESDFYPYRYLASEGFLPGYNFPRLPVRVFIPRGDGEFIARSRFLGHTEFAPQNIIYHEGAKYQVTRFLEPPGGLEQRRQIVKICNPCGYWQSSSENDQCENCGTTLDASNSDKVPVLEMSNVRTERRERITSDEEERTRRGYDIRTCFRFAPDPGGQKRKQEAVVEANGSPVLRLIYAPTATLYRINNGWRNRREKGFLIDLVTGEMLGGALPANLPPSRQPQRPELVRLSVQDTTNLMLVYFVQDDWSSDERILTSLQYALKRGMEDIFQLEESELATERIGAGASQALLFWESAAGGAGVLRRVVEERDVLAQVAKAGLMRCHFSAENGEDYKRDCLCACYECLLSYGNQRDHFRLDRHRALPLLNQLASSVTDLRRAGRSPEEHYHWLYSLTDSRSELERRFIEHLYRTGRRLPDEAQRRLTDFYAAPDFYYEPNVCVFCDGSVHDEPAQKMNDETLRRQLKEYYRVVVIRYDRDLEEQINHYKDIFGEGKR
jgi:superfamily II DNA/RNA helicase